MTDAPPPAPPAASRVGGIAAVSLLLPIAGSVVTLAVAPFVAPWLRGQGALGLVYFTVAFAVLGGLLLAPTYSTSVLAGWTFGFARGFPAIVIGTLGGAVFCYAVARWLMVDRVRGAFRAHPKWEVVRRAMVDASPARTLWLVFLLRLSPVLPFGTTNVLLATTGVRLRLYVVGTLLGLMPRTGLVALASAGAERLDFDAAESWWLLAAGIVTTGVCIAVFAYLGKRALARATGRDPSAA